MRTTIRLPDDLLAQAKQLAAKRQCSLTSVIEEGLRDMLARHDSPSADHPVKLITVAGTGVAPGVDLDDSAALLETMDSGDDPAGR